MLSTIKDNLDRIVDKFRLVEKYGDDGAKKIIGSIKSNLLIKVDDTNDRLEELKNDLLDFYIEEEVDEIMEEDFYSEDLFYALGHFFRNIILDKDVENTLKNIISLKDDVTFFVDDSGWSLRVFL